MRFEGVSRWKLWMVVCVWCYGSAFANGDDYRVPITVVTPAELANVPCDPLIDFEALSSEHGLRGEPNLNSIRVIDRKTGQRVPHALGSGFQHGPQGRIEWVMADPRQHEFEIQFSLVPQRVPVVPPSNVPLIGTGDLLRYNAGKPRPIVLAHSARLVDLTGDGRLDLVGCWNYAYRPGEPWNGVVCYPRVGEEGTFHFGDRIQLRYRAEAGAELKSFTHTYLAADVADVDRDGHTDLVVARRGAKRAEFYRNTGERDAGGMPIFEPAGSMVVPGWEACRAVDLDEDGILDLVVDGVFVRNQNGEGWPFQPAEAITLDAGRKPGFVDVNGDGRLDAVCLQGAETAQPNGYRIAWRMGLGGSLPTFSAEKTLTGIDGDWCTMVGLATDGDRVGLLIQHDVYQSVSLFEQTGMVDDEPRFERRARAESTSAVMSLSDQAWPSTCDWDDDGDLDLLVGGGYGWPRIVINEGTRTEPRFAEPKRILADGEPIRFVRNEILGEPDHGHDMGYPYPVFVRWDDDDLPDLICPNETNRIFWFRNVGTQGSPQFSGRRQLLVEGYPESDESRRRSAERALEATYPLEKEQPFFWRTAAAFADWNGDGLTDLITHSGDTRQATLFAQYRDATGTLRLRREKAVLLTDDRPIDDRIVNRRSHWTEGFRAYDWNSDGLMDLIYSCAGSHAGIQDNGSIYLLLNRGTRETPVFSAPQTMRCFGEPIRITNHGPNAWPCDFDGDGQPDLITCVEWSVYPFYSHAALTMPERPKFVWGRPTRTSTTRAE